MAENNVKDEHANHESFRKKAPSNHKSESTYESAMQLCQRYSWTIRGDHKFPRSSKPALIPRLAQLPPLMKMLVNYPKFWLRSRRLGQKIPMDHAGMQPYRPVYGVPCGGIGSGSIGRGFNGEFRRFQMMPGMYSYHTVDGNVFILTIFRQDQDTGPEQLVLSTRSKPKKCLRSWMWGDIPVENCTYSALYPQAWWHYDLSQSHGLRLTCRQVSPVVPHDYVDSSLPATLFVWHVENTSNEPCGVSITMCWENSLGDPILDKGIQPTNETFVRLKDGSNYRGLTIDETVKGVRLTYCIATQPATSADRRKLTTGCRVTGKLFFNPRSDGLEIWKDLLNENQLDLFAHGQHYTQPTSGPSAVALCNFFDCLAPGSTAEFRFSLVWHQPDIVFPGSTALPPHRRRYTRFTKNNMQFGMPGPVGAANIAMYALSQVDNWITAIESWQLPILTNEKLPDFFKCALLNETYFLSDGGGIWIEYDSQRDLQQRNLQGSYKTEPDLTEEHSSRLAEYGRFAYLEGHEYQDKRPATHILHSSGGICKAAMAVPHDVGDPYGSPFDHLNAYFVHPTDQWKDLNPKMVLMIYRDFVFSGRDVQWLRALYDLVPALVEKTEAAFDVDHDGMIENSGFADQTFDTWIMTGVSAYCGCLWVCALEAASRLAFAMGLADDGERFLNKARTAYAVYEEKLWNGSYFRFDCGRHAEVVMADQMAGAAYFLATGEPSIVLDAEKVRLSLRSVHRWCLVAIPPARTAKERRQSSSSLQRHGSVARRSVRMRTLSSTSLGRVFWKDSKERPFELGTNSTLFKHVIDPESLERNIRLPIQRDCDRMGLINGVFPSQKESAPGKVDVVSVQSEELWTGVNYLIAAAMIDCGLTEEGWDVLRAMFNTTFNLYGLQFQTPEAYNRRNEFRSLGYMRPLAIWAVYNVLTGTRANPKDS